MRRPNLPRTHSPCASLRSASPTLRLSGTANISGVPGISSNWRAQKSKRSYGTANRALPRSCSESFGTVTWSECPKRSAQDADALLTRRQRLVTPPDHHWWTGSPPCLDNVLATRMARLGQQQSKSRLRKQTISRRATTPWRQLGGLHADPGRTRLA